MLLIISQTIAQHVCYKELDQAEKGRHMKTINLQSKITRQRDSARTERDLARTERDSAVDERDTLKFEVSQLKDTEIGRKQFVATLSHDLRNPIGVIKSAVELLRSEQTVQQFEAMIDMIDRNADIAEDLIRHLLDATLIEAGGKLPINPIQCDILSILIESRETFIPISRERIVFQDLEKKAYWGYWDPFALKRAFNNLLSNALKFSDPDKKIRIFAEEAFGSTDISIQNFGKLISHQDQEKIFKSHFKVEGNKMLGWGLGLTLVRGVAEAHGGSVDIVSNENDGTIFTMKLPRKMYGQSPEMD